MAINGAKLFGHTPVIQGDNSGPHDDSTFKKFVEEYYLSNGCSWEPQAPQMPHVNVLDLAAFPAMSMRHSHLARSFHVTRVLKEDEIWETEVKAWETLPSSKVGNAFAIAKKVAEKVIQSKRE